MDPKKVQVLMVDDNEADVSIKHDSLRKWPFRPMLRFISGLYVTLLLIGCASRSVEPIKITSVPKQEGDLARTSLSERIQLLDAQMQATANRQEELFARMSAALPGESEDTTMWIWVVISMIGTLFFVIGYQVGKRSKPTRARRMTPPHRISEAA